MKIGIENIKTVYWKLKALANNLYINNEDKALEICAEHEDSYKFTNTHHKAQQEVEYLALNKNHSLLKSYYKKYEYCLDDIKETCSKYDNKSLITQVYIYLIPTLEVFDEIKEHVTLDELKNQTKTLDNSQPKKNEEKQEPPKTRKYTANEYALAYIFDLNVKGESIPTNRVEGGLAKNEIEQIGESEYKLKGDTFYRAVRKVKEFDLNSKTHLENISKDWYNAIMQISNNDKDLKEFLIKKQLI